MKVYIYIFGAAALAASSTLNPVLAATVTDTVGDSDCFGLGGSCADGDLWRDELGGVFDTDYRSAIDLALAPHTDIWDSPQAPSWTHSYDLAGETATSAVFDIVIAGFADTSVAVDLLVDGTTVATYDFPGELQTVHFLSVPVPLGLIDGASSIVLSTNGIDGFINDYSTITIKTTAVPAPAAAWLFGSGFLGLIGIARRMKS